MYLSRGDYLRCIFNFNVVSPHLNGSHDEMFQSLKYYELFARSYHSEQISPRTFCLPTGSYYKASKMSLVS